MVMHWSFAQLSIDPIDSILLCRKVWEYQPFFCRDLSPRYWATGIFLFFRPVLDRCPVYYQPGSRISLGLTEVFLFLQLGRSAHLCMVDQRNSLYLGGIDCPDLDWRLGNNNRSSFPDFRIFSLGIDSGPQAYRSNHPLLLPIGCTQLLCFYFLFDNVQEAGC